MIAFDQVVVWIFVGLLGGSLAGLLVRRERSGFGLVRNLGLGLAGAVVGGLLFRLLGILPGLESYAVSLRDIVAAAAGSLIILLAPYLMQRNRPSNP